VKQETPTEHWRKYLPTPNQHPNSGYSPTPSQNPNSE